MPERFRGFLVTNQRWVASIALCTGFALLTGCDKIQIPQVGQEPASAPVVPTGGAPTAAQATPNPATASVDVPVQTAKPGPREVIAAFLDKASKPGGVGDQDLLDVTELTEGLEEVQELKLSGDKITDVGVARLSKFPRLSTLDLSATRVTNQGVTVLKDLPELRHLGLGYTMIDDKAMGLVGELKELTELNIARTPVSDFGIAQLENLNHLEVLDISESSGITGASFQKLKSNKKLRVLRAHHSGIRGAAMKFLAQCPIEELDLNATGMTDEGMLTIARMNKLRTLSLEFCAITDYGINKMVVMKDLETVSFRNNGSISNLLFEKLMKCKKLKSVNVVGTRINASDAATLMKLLPGCQVTF